MPEDARGPILPRGPVLSMGPLLSMGGASKGPVARRPRSQRWARASTGPDLLGRLGCQNACGSRGPGLLFLFFQGGLCCHGARNAWGARVLIRDTCWARALHKDRVGRGSVVSGAPDCLGLVLQGNGAAGKAVLPVELCFQWGPCYQGARVRAKNCGYPGTHVYMESYGPGPQ